MTIPNAQISVCIVCLVSLSSSLKSSKAIHLVEPFAFVEVVPEVVVIIRDMPKSASNGSAESDIKMLSY